MKSLSTEIYKENHIHEISKVLWSWNIQLSELKDENFIYHFYNYTRSAIAQSVETSAPGRRARVRGSPGENCHVH